MKQQFLIRVLMTDDKTRAKALKIAVQFKGVTGVEIKGVNRNQILVIGDEVDIIGLLNTLRKKLGYAALLHVDKVEPPKDGDKKPNKTKIFRSKDLKGVEAERDGILWAKNLYRYLKEAENVQAEAKIRRDDGLNLRKDDNLFGKTNSDATFALQNCVKNKNVVPVIEEKKLDLSDDFVGDLVKALKKNGVNVYMEVDEFPGGDLTELLFNRMSSMALIIFSRSYVESVYCLNELVKIKELMKEGKLLVIPIFYKMESSEVTQLMGDFGDKFWNSWRTSRDHHVIQWKEALESVASKKGIYLKEDGSESEFITLTVKEVLQKLSLQKGENPSLYLSTCKAISHATYTLQNCVKNKIVVPIVEEKKLDLSDDFVGDLVKGLKKKGVNVSMDVNEFQGGDLMELLFNGIEESGMALVIFSSRYAESRWCLNELVKINELMEEGKLIVIPIFYKLGSLEVTQLMGDFGVKFWNSWRTSRDHHVIQWKEALKSVASLKGICLKEDGSESEFITLTVKEVLKILSLQKGENPSLLLSTCKGKSTDLPTGKGEKHETYLNKCQLFGMEQRMEQLERKLGFDCKETRIIGVIGMPGIGKTTLAMMLHDKWSCKFIRSVPLLSIRKRSEKYGPMWMRQTLLDVLLEGKVGVISETTTHEYVKVELLQKKIFAVLDDVSDKKQLEFLLNDLDWIKKGSKIVITTSDKSLLEGFVNDIYVVPLLNNQDAFQLLTYHAFYSQISPSETLLSLSRVFVDNVGGNPLVLQLLGCQLYEKTKEQWNEKLLQLTSGSNSEIRDVLRISFDQLNKRQKDAFLDIVVFFRSENEYLVRSLLDSRDPDSTDVVSEVRDLANRFLITISDSRVEVSLHMFSKYLGSPERHRLWNYEDIIKKLMNMEKSEANNMRGIFLDLSKVAESIALERMTFANMLNLRYLKIYDSCCPRQCKADCKLYFHDGLEFNLQEVRYLHWLKFPLEELPPDFKPDNLVDLRLPYSKIVRVWNGVKDTPRLKWIDLSYSSKLLELSVLSKAENLQRLNLEGCTILEELPVETKNMKSLVFLNLRGCINLSYLPAMNLLSLKTLILSGCANLEEFHLISENLEVIHLDGTVIKELPQAIKKLQRLVLLNLMDCKMLKELPNCLKELKALQELILSGCSMLKDLSDIRESMSHLQSLLIDRIGAKEMPKILCVTKAKAQAFTDLHVEPIGPSKWPLDVSEVSSLQRLSLSGNDFVSLKTDIVLLYNLKWLDLKQCKRLKSVPMLPPRLQYFDAHGCDSLESVANPLALPLPVLPGQIHATFIFSNCYKLDQDAKDSIISYTRWRSQLMLDELIQYNGGVVLEALIGTCLPGFDVPSWFSHQASGHVLKPKLPPHWCDNRSTRIALCAVILFPTDHQQRMNRLMVKCDCVFNNDDGSHIRLSFTIGSWSEPSSTQGKTEPSHVFIGYTNILNIQKYGEELEEGCDHTKASFEFQVTDGTQLLEGCEVRKCGFSLVYATVERENICWDPKTVVIPEKMENIPSEARSYGNFKSHDDFQYESYSDLTLGMDESFFSEEESYTTPNLQKIFENKRVDLLNEEIDIGENSLVRSYHDNISSENLEKLNIHSLVGVEVRLKQMEEVLYSTPRDIDIVGVVGMPGIGKTTLATILFQKHGCKFPSHLFLTISKECELQFLRRILLEELLKHKNQDINDDTTHESVNDKLLETKVFVVLDGVSSKKQLDFLLSNLNWVKKGSKIVITTCDKSLLVGLAHNIYVVPGLNNKEAFRLLTYHAFCNHICPSDIFMLLSRMFVANSGGNPRDLKSLGNVLSGKDEAFWQHELQRVRKKINMKMRDIWRCSIDQLNNRERDVFLDKAYFFKSESEFLVRSLVNSGNPEALSEVRDLIDKFLITISGERVEMYNQLSTLDFSSPGQHRLWNYKDIINKLTKMKQQEANHVRGVILDVSKLTKSIALECMTFIDMHNLLYLKIYNSCCPRQAKVNCNLYLPDGIKFSLKDIRYLHWVEFPLEELPPEFNPENLVDLKLPYSKFERVWEGVKDTPRLKWVDLSHSSKLLHLSALSTAVNLQRLNLEGCTSLNELPVEIENMKSLVFLNLRGCTRLWSLPKINLISLKTLILSDCSNLREFKLISTSVEFLHLDSTSIQGLPLAIQNLQRLVLLNLKNCKLLECLPNCLGNLNALEELILSGCSRLKNVPDVRNSLKHLKILLLDWIGATEMPSVSCFTGFEGPSLRVVNILSSMRHLCLSGNDLVSLDPHIDQLYNLKWLEVKQCRKLRSVPMLPPRLQYFDAHDCDSLETVANPLVFPVLSEQIHSIFNFANCSKLDQRTKDSIILSTRWKSQLVLDELSRYNRGLVLEVLIGTCFPGWEVPAWFIHQASGSVLKPKLSPHWCENRFSGFGFCAVIIFHGYHAQRKRILVKCNCEFKNEDGSITRFSYTVGGWSKPCNTPWKFESSHVLIGFTSRLDINKIAAEDYEEKCFYTETSITFQVTDGTEEIKGCEVLKCGFNLIYESEERGNIYSDSKTAAIPIEGE